MILDFIATLTADDPAQAHAKEWARRARELQRRQAELRDKALALFDAGDDYASTVAEHSKVSAELSELCHKVGDFLSRLRPSTETRQ